MYSSSSLEKSSRLTRSPLHRDDDYVRHDGRIDAAATSQQEEELHLRLEDSDSRHIRGLFNTFTLYKLYFVMVISCHK